ncbi:MAG: hypothetical protein ACI9EW_003419 [Cellvibrionaceae bacterium]|jgi:hypothetical protein
MLSSPDLCGHCFDLNAGRYPNQPMNATVLMGSILVILLAPIFLALSAWVAVVEQGTNEGLEEQ